MEMDFSLWALFLRATFSVKIVMLLLIVASFWSWSIIIQKFIDLRRARADTDAFEQTFWSGEPLDADKRCTLGHLLRREAEAQSVELAGIADQSPEQRDRRQDTAASARHFYAYLALPTLVYEVSYPRTKGVDWRYVAEKAGAAAAVLAAMALICQDLMYPVIVDAAAWESARGWDAHRRLRELPWLVSDLMLPLTLQYIVSTTSLPPLAASGNSHLSP